MLILVHDLDTNKLEELRAELKRTTKGHSFDHHLICIPIQEIEAWFLSDGLALRDVCKLKKTPKMPISPEKVVSPKEFLENLVYKESNKGRRYLNTKDNEKMALKISLVETERKCPSFKELSLFLRGKVY